MNSSLKSVGSSITHSGSEPQSKRAKDKTRFNAVKDGVFARSRLLPGEDEAEYKRMSTEFLEENKPNSSMERTLVELLIASKWRIQRIAQAQVALFDRAQKSRLSKRLQSLTDKEFEVAKSMVSDTETLRSVEYARADWKYKVAFETFGWDRPRNNETQKPTLSPEEVGELLDTVKKKLEGIDDLDNVLLEAMTSPDKFSAFAALESARRAEERDMTRHYAMLLELQDRRLTIEATRPVEQE